MTIGRTRGFLVKPSRPTMMANLVAATLSIVATPGSLAAAELQTPDFFGTVALEVLRTPMDSKWKQAQKGDAVSLGQLGRAAVAQALGLKESEKIAAINLWVNHHIRYVRDSERFLTEDHWATPAATLSQLAGDCEDYAILKRRLLVEAGIRPDNIFLVVARDLVARTDHALLAVITADGPIFLDNRTDELLSSESSIGLLPVFTFGERGKWTHGFRVATAHAGLTNRLAEKGSNPLGVGN